MNPFDVARYVIFAEAGASFAFMAGTNVLAFLVLRPPRKLGFLWWHVVSVSLAICLISAVAIERVVGRLGEPATWRTYVMFIGLTLMLVAQVIIYSVERHRYIARKVVDRHGDIALARALAELDEG